MLKKFALLFLGLLGSLFVSGCETTGDPHTGGIFWSETKAQQRLDDRQDHLDAVRGDTASTRSSNARLEGAAARREALLGQ